MGYGLPAAIGLCIAAGKKPTVCLEGDGSIMMNLQELQTIITNKLPIKIFLINSQSHFIYNIDEGFDYLSIAENPQNLKITNKELNTFKI